MLAKHGPDYKPRSTVKRNSEAYLEAVKAGRPTLRMHQYALTGALTGAHLGLPRAFVAAPDVATPSPATPNATSEAPARAWWQRLIGW